MSFSAMVPCDLSESEFAEISALVMRMCGINLHNGKRELVKARLSKRLRALGLNSYREYMRHVEHDGSGVELAKMLDALSTNLTFFFRESQHLDYLGDEVLPQLAKDRGKGADRRLRIWSAGCSSGEEPYSIAVTLLEHLSDAARWDIGILATDISNQMLERAKRGVYEEARFRDMPTHLRGRYFSQVSAGPPKLFEAQTQLRSMVHFARLNLMEPWPMRGPFDIIFCRNVMIYFDKATQEKIINRFSQILAPHGVLFVGHSESLSGISHQMQQLRPTVYQTKS